LGEIDNDAKVAKGFEVVVVEKPNLRALAVQIQAWRLAYAKLYRR
jgi:hypothetical protein